MLTEEIIADILARCLTVAGMCSSDDVYLQARAPGRSPRHAECAVGIVRESPSSDRQRRGMSHETAEVRVLLSWQLSGVRLASAAGNPGGEAAWHAADRAIRLAILTPRTTGYEVRWTGTDRSSGAKEWVYSELSFTVIYPVPLT